MASTERLAPGDFVKVRGRIWIVETVRENRPSVVGLICVDDDAQGDRLEVDLLAGIANSAPLESSKQC